MMRAAREAWLQIRDQVMVEIDAQPGSDVLIEEPESAPYIRHPADFARLIAGVGLMVLGVVAALVVEDAVTGFERDLVSYFAGLNDGLEHFLVGLVQLAIVTIPLVGTLLLVITRRWRALGYTYLAGIVAGNLDRLFNALLDRVEPSAFAEAVGRDGWIAGADFPDSPWLASAFAVATVAAPWMNRQWRRIVFVGLLLAVVARLLAGTALPASLLLTVATGWTVGSAVLVIFGAPNRRVSGAAIADALARSGLGLRSLTAASVDARGSMPFFADTTGGDPLFVKALGSSERSADVLFRVYRNIRFQNLGDEKPFSSLRRAVEHEALLALAAADVGVRTPRLRAVVDVDGTGDTMVLAYDRIDGRSLDSVDRSELTDEVLRSVWEQVATMRSHRIAHRDLRLANVFVAADERAWMIDFGFSELAASNELLATDVAELLCSTAVMVGAERSVAAAVDTIGPEAVATALPRLQPNALSGATRDALKADKPLLGSIREAAQERCSVDQIELEQLQRVKPSAIVGFLALAGAVYFLLPQLADAPRMFERISEASWGWVVLGLVVSGFTYIGATISMMGSVPNHLRLWDTFLAQLASTFTNRITPAQAGGYALNVRYLQKSGVDSTIAVTGVGLNTLGGIVIHVSLLIIFLFWVGNDGLRAFHLPSATTFGWITLALVALGGLTLAVPFGRRFFFGKVVPALKKALAGLAAVARRPSKLLALLGGSFIVTVSYLVILLASVQAFGGGLAIASVGVAYLAGSAVASAAPTPGGLGAAEAAYMAGLTAFGLDDATALSAVFLFRAVTFWLPILPGWLALRVMQRRGDI